MRSPYQYVGPTGCSSSALHSSSPVVVSRDRKMVVTWIRSVMSPYTTRDPSALNS